MNKNFFVFVSFTNLLAHIKKKKSPREKNAILAPLREAIMTHFLSKSSEKLFLGWDRFSGIYPYLYTSQVYK